MKVSRDQSMSSTFAPVIAGAAIIMRMKSRDMINMVDPAMAVSFLRTPSPLEAIHTAKGTGQDRSLP